MSEKDTGGQGDAKQREYDPEVHDSQLYHIAREYWPFLPGYDIPNIPSSQDRHEERNRPAFFDPTESSKRLLTKDEEQVLALAVQGGKELGGFVQSEEQMEPDEKTRKANQDIQIRAQLARDIFVVANQRLIAQIGTQYGLFERMSRDDVYSKGSIGLLIAVDKYEPGKGRFGTYAHWWVRKTLLDRIEAEEGGIHLPKDMLPVVRTVKRERASREEQLSVQDLVNITGYPQSQIIAALQYIDLLEYLIPLDAPISEDENILLRDLVPDNFSEPVEDKAIYKVLIEEMTDALGHTSVAEIASKKHIIIDDIKTQQKKIARNIRPEKRGKLLQDLFSHLGPDDTSILLEECIGAMATEGIPYGVSKLNRLVSKYELEDIFKCNPNLRRKLEDLADTNVGSPHQYEQGEVLMTMFVLSDLPYQPEYAGAFTNAKEVERSLGHIERAGMRKLSEIVQNDLSMGSYSYRLIPRRLFPIFNLYNRGFTTSEILGTFGLEDTKGNRRIITTIIDQIGFSKSPITSPPFLRSAYARVHGTTAYVSQMEAYFSQIEKASPPSPMRDAPGYKNWSYSNVFFQVYRKHGESLIQDILSSASVDTIASNYGISISAIKATLSSLDRYILDDEDIQTIWSNDPLDHPYRTNAGFRSNKDAVESFQYALQISTERSELLLSLPLRVNTILSFMKDYVDHCTPASKDTKAYLARLHRVSDFHIDCQFATASLYADMTHRYEIAPNEIQEQMVRGFSRLRFVDYARSQITKT
jgi:RNA polymerase sigma factor (sigma-70 family)